MQGTGVRPEEAGAPPGGAASLLEVRGLTIEVQSGAKAVRVVEDQHLSVRRGEVVGVVGESGSGKSLTALSLMRLLPPRARVAGGSAVFDGVDLFSLDPSSLRRLRGRRIAMVFQDPLTSLNPMMTIGWQLAEAVRLHDRSVRRGSARDRAGETLRLVGFPAPARLLDAYPHELSGGMRQRAMIAMAMINDPDLVIADEPTTALDVTTQAQVLDALQAAREQVGSALILISHDLGVIGERADRVQVMYHGRTVERATAEKVLSEPRHPYTRALLASRPSLEQRGRLEPIPGRPARGGERLPGCSFAPRCPRSQARCQGEVPPLAAVEQADDHDVACYFPDRAPLRNVGPVEQRAVAVSSGAGGVPLVSVEELVVRFRARSGWFRPRSAPVAAVDGVSFTMDEGRTLGLVGESGSGKSTIARAVLGLLRADAGEVRFAGENVTGLRGAELRTFHRRAQIVQQDPFSALNPRKTVGDTLAEALRVHGIVPREQVRLRVRDLLESVGLRSDFARRFPHEFSGGELQRVCIARALSVEPDFMVLDEPVSSLDVSIQAQILNLLADLQDARRLAFLFVTHDLAVARSVTDEVAVLYRGRIVERGPSEQILRRPEHPYTRLLIAAVPEPRRERTASRAVVERPDGGDVTAGGCRFRDRCLFAAARCAEAEPTLQLPTSSSEPGHLVACHFAGSLGDRIAKRPLPTKEERAL